MNLKNSAEQMGKIFQLESEVRKVKAELQETRAVDLSARVLLSMYGIGKSSTTSVKQVQTSYSGAKKLCSGITSASVEKPYKLMVKSKSNQLSDKDVLKANINPTEMKIGIKTQVTERRACPY